MARASYIPILHQSFLLARSSLHARSLFSASSQWRRTLASAATASSLEKKVLQQQQQQQPFFPDEPRAPQIRTQIPGPKSKKAIEELDRVFDTRSLNMLADYKSSYGN
ncbi:MAG: 4-aminobutyrate transaminase [Peltula sp. TS41687]|nr:MAG: 4-aminobutyrate transaminase [Peltula sp. TS41687]